MAQPLILKYLPDAINTLFPLRPGYKRYTTWQTYPQTDNLKDNNLYGINCHKYQVIDIDTKARDKNKYTNEQAKEGALTWLQTLGVNTDTFMVETRSGGLHLYYLAPPDLPYDHINRKKNKLGIVIPNGYGQIDLPGNVTGPNIDLHMQKVKDSYKVISTTLPIKLPRWASLQLMKTPPGAAAEVINIDTGTDYLSALQAYKDKYIPHSSRDTYLFHIIGYLLRKNLSDEEIVMKLLPMVQQPKPSDKWEEITPEFIMGKITTEKLKCITQEENRLEWALSEYYYITSVDKIFVASIREAKTFSDLKNYRPEKLQIGINTKGAVYVALIEAWLEHPDRREIQDLGFKPNDQAIYTFEGKIYGNTYMDNRVAPWGEAVSRDDPDIKPYFQILDNICDYDNDSINLMEEHYARKINNPMHKTRWGPYYISQWQGVGKQLNFDIISSLVGSTHAVRVKGKNLTSEFNAEYFSALMILVDEANGVAGEAGQEALKMLIGDMYGNIRAMRRDRQTTRQPYHHITELHSNSVTGVKISPDDRRFYIIHSISRPLDDEVYNNAGKMLPSREIDNDEHSTKCLSKLRRYFQDLVYLHDEFPQRAPKSKWKKEVSVQSQDNLVQMIMQGIDEGSPFFDSDIITTQSVMEFLKVEHHYTKVSPQKIAAALNNLIELNLCHRLTETKASNNWPRILGGGYDGAIPEKVMAKRHNPRVYCIRDFNTYIGMSLDELRDVHYYPHLSQVNR